MWNDFEIFINGRRLTDVDIITLLQFLQKPTTKNLLSFKVYWS